MLIRDGIERLWVEILRFRHQDLFFALVAEQGGALAQGVGLAVGLADVLAVVHRVHVDQLRLELPRSHMMDIAAAGEHKGEHK